MLNFPLPLSPFSLSSEQLGSEKNTATFAIFAKLQRFTSK
jgi:hypothetical protein